MKLILLFFLFLSVDITASDLPDSGDQYYVWARNGLNMRSGPGTSYDILDKLSFGESIEFILESDITYNLTALPNIDSSHYRFPIEKTQPFIMYGRWWKIKTSNGKVGYAISQYLLDLKPVKVKEDLLHVPLELESVDTVYKSEVYRGGEFVDLKVKYGHPKNIVNTIGSGGVFVSSTVEFPNMTIAEVLVIMGIEGSYLKILRNWKEQLILSDGGMTSIYMTLEDNKVEFHIVYAC